MRPYYYLGGNRALTQLSNGLPFYVNTQDGSISPWIILGGTWENFVDDVLCALAFPGHTFLDVGANLGYYTIKVGNLVGPQGRVYSFEPNPELYTFLLNNIHINGFTGRVTPHRLAAGAAAGYSVLHFNYLNMGGGHVDVPGAATKREDGVTVGIARLDDVLPTDKPVDLIKIDAEGFEPLIFQGMQQVLARSPNAAIVTEISVPEWRRFGDPMSILKQVCGPRLVYLISQNGKLTRLKLEEFEARFSPDFLSYALLLPDRSESLRAIQKFVNLK